jgi:hypothetical protein
MDLRSRNGESPSLRWRRRLTRRAVWWAAASAISLSVMLARGGVLLWALYQDSRSPRVMSFGVTLLALGFAASAMCLGLWLVSGNDHGPGDGP